MCNFNFLTADQPVNGFIPYDLEIFKGIGDYIANLHVGMQGSQRAHILDQTNICKNFNHKIVGSIVEQIGQ